MPTPTPTIITISRPNFARQTMRLTGTQPYMQARFSQKSIIKMRELQELGPAAKKGRAKEPRNFDADFLAAQHRAEDGWPGIPAAAFRNAAIAACRVVGFQMTRARMSIFIEADGLDAIDATPLVRIRTPDGAGEPERSEMTVRNATGVVDIRVRPLWRRWYVDLTIRYDADQFTAEDVANLMERAGQQVGVGEGRVFSKASNGLGFGTFTTLGE